MITVFILESWDEFGAHGIDGIFSTKEKAEEAKKQLIQKDEEKEEWLFRTREWIVDKI